MVSDANVMAVAAALDSGRDPQRALVACTEAAIRLDAAGQHRLLAGLGELIGRYPSPLAGRIAICAGTIVEGGADPAAFPAAVFEKITAFLDALPAAPLQDTEPDAGQELPEEFYDFELAAIACLARSPSIRREQKARLWPKIRRYSERYGFLGKMLSMLDEEPLIVVDVSTGGAWRVVIDGIADNFQLHALLNGALARAAPRLPFGLGRRVGISGRPLHPRIVAASADGPPVDLPVVSFWQLACWRALEPGGRLEAGHEHWIWNEGVPADIEPLDGTRIVLIAPGSIERSWNSGRVFPEVKGSLRVEKALAMDEADILLERILERKNESPRP